MASQPGITARMSPAVMAVWPAPGSRASASAIVARIAWCASWMAGRSLVVTFGCGL